MHNLILGLMASVFACALITNMIKITVGVIVHAAVPLLERLVAHCLFSVAVFKFALHLLLCAFLIPAWGVYGVTAFEIHKRHLCTASIAHTAGVSTQNTLSAGSKLVHRPDQPYFMVPKPLLHP